MLNIINDNFKKIFSFFFIVMFVFSYLSINNCIFSEKKAFATPMPKEDQDKLGNDWVLSQYLTSGIKIKTKSGVTSQARNRISEIMDYVMPPGLKYR